MLNKIKIITINVNGIQSNKRINYLENYLLKEKVDIACLQEVGPFIKNFKHPNYNVINNHTTNNLGTAIIVHERLQIESSALDVTNRIIKKSKLKTSLSSMYMDT